MKITLTFLQRDKNGRQRTTKVTGDVVGPSENLVVLRQLWEAERAINEHTSLRCYVEVTEE